MDWVARGEEGKDTAKKPVSFLPGQWVEVLRHHTTTTMLSQSKQCMAAWPTTASIIQQPSQQQFLSARTASPGIAGFLRPCSLLAPNHKQKQAQRVGWVKMPSITRTACDEKLAWPRPAALLSTPARHSSSRLAASLFLVLPRIPHISLHKTKHTDTMADVGVNDVGGGAGGGVAGGGQARRVVDALGQVVRGRFTDFLQTFRVRVYCVYVCVFMLHLCKDGERVVLVFSMIALLDLPASSFGCTAARSFPPCPTQLALHLFPVPTLFSPTFYDSQILVFINFPFPYSPKTAPRSSPGSQPTKPRAERPTAAAATGAASSRIPQPSRLDGLRRQSHPPRRLQPPPCP